MRIVSWLVAALLLSACADRITPKQPNVYEISILAGDQAEADAAVLRQAADIARQNAKPRFAVLTAGTSSQGYRSTGVTFNYRTTATIRLLDANEPAPGGTKSFDAATIPSQPK